MLIIDWPGTPIAGFIDYIPMDWFAREGKTARRMHFVVGPKNERLEALCSVDVRRTEAILDYRGKHAGKNDDNGIDNTVCLKIVFTNARRNAVENLLWRDADQKVFQDSHIWFSSGEDDVAVREGGQKLVRHMRAERRPALAMRKKKDVIGTLGYLTCEACECDLRNIYGPTKADSSYEVHHRVQLSGGPDRMVRLKDLAVLCANCHRAIHRTKPMLSVEDFRRILWKDSKLSISD